jgi:hypothetical protein
MDQGQVVFGDKQFLDLLEKTENRRLGPECFRLFVFVAVVAKQGDDAVAQVNFFRVRADKDNPFFKIFLFGRADESFQ